MWLKSTQQLVVFWSSLVVYAPREYCLRSHASRRRCWCLPRGEAGLGSTPVSSLFFLGSVFLVLSQVYTVFSVFVRQFCPPPPLARPTHAPSRLSFKNISTVLVSSSVVDHTHTRICLLCCRCPPPLFRDSDSTIRLLFAPPPFTLRVPPPLKELGFLASVLTD